MVRFLVVQHVVYSNGGHGIFAHVTHTTYRSPRFLTASQLKWSLSACVGEYPALWNDIVAIYVLF